MKIITLIAMCLLLSGCATLKKRELRARTFYVEYPDKLAELSNTLFPSRDVFKPGTKTIMPADTVYVAGDTVVVTVDCPDGTKVPVRYVKGDTVKVYIPILQRDTIEKSNTVEVERWKNEERKESEARIRAESKLAVSDARVKELEWWRIGLFVLLGAIGAVFIWSRFSGGAVVEKIKRLF